jgi:hypothetical protein
MSNLLKTSQKLLKIEEKLGKTVLFMQSDSYCMHCDAFFVHINSNFCFVVVVCLVQMPMHETSKGTGSREGFDFCCHA